MFPLSGCLEGGRAVPVSPVDFLVAGVLSGAALACDSIGLLIWKRPLPSAQNDLFLM